MVLEEQSQKCCNSTGSGGVGNSGRSSKRQKPKKVPQRGLGVAQLEKIRLEEQRKKDEVVAAASAILPFSSPTTISPSQKSSYLSLPIPAFHRPSNQQPSSTSLVPFPGDLAPANSIFRPKPSSPNIDIPLPNTPLLWPAGAVPCHGTVQSFWSINEHNLDKANSGVDPGLAFRGNFNLPDESEPIWPQPSLMQRAHQYKQPSSAMVNVSSTSSPSLLNFGMEHPSNQNYYGNCTIFCSEEEKMGGMKRPYPFSTDNPAGPSFHYKYPPITHAINRSDEQASIGHETIFRGPPCSTFTSEPNTEKSVKENGVFCGDFLTLAPPTSISMSSSSKAKHQQSNPHFYNHEFPDFESLTRHQGCLEDEVIGQRQGGLNPRWPYYSFFPAAIVQVGQATTTTITCNGGREVGESVDLNLKL